MMKRIFTAFLAAALLLTSAACGKKAPAAPTLKEGLTLKSVVDDIGNEIGITMPAEVDESILKDIVGIEPEDVEEYAGYVTMVMISADNLIAVKAKEGKVETVQKALAARQETVVKSFEQYLPSELDKAKAGKVITIGDYVFLVKDNGIGMSQDFVQHIFEPFERERNSTTSGIQGTGLGMAITKNIVDMMNGTISVRSKQGVGTEFIVVVTFRLCTEEREPQTIPELKNCRALVVDDDFNTCDSVSYMLGQIGLRAEWTMSGKEAVLRTHQAVMRGDNYSVYIIDWLMPDMNGVEVTRRIRKELGEEVPVILLTAYDWLDIEEEAKEAGVTAFCSKPLFLSELRSCLHSIVDTEEETADGAQKHAGRRTGRILLAEDNELNQEIATAILEDAGFETEVAGNGRIAVDMLKKAGPGYYQLVLMDVRMPVMDGYGATREIRSLEDPALASVPILAMTANAFEEDRQEALASGMNGHLSKPIDVEMLFDTLDKILGK